MNTLRPGQLDITGISGFVTPGGPELSVQSVSHLGPWFVGVRRGVEALEWLNPVFLSAASLHGPQPGLALFTWRVKQVTLARRECDQELGTVCQLVILDGNPMSH